MSGFHFFVESNGGQWHRTEDRGAPDDAAAAHCECGIYIDDSRVMKVRGHDDDSWQWVPPRAVAKCFPEEMRDPKPKEPKREPLTTDERILDIIAERDALRTELRDVMLARDTARLEARALDEQAERISETLKAENGERTKDLHVMTQQGRAIDELREKLRVAEAVRDDARASSQRYLDEKREVQERLRRAVVDWRLEVDKLLKQLREEQALVASTANERDRMQRMLDTGEKLRVAAEDGYCLASDAASAATAFEAEISVLRSQKDAAYTERDRCVAAVAALAVRLGWSAWLGKHRADEKWDDDWRNIVFINLPTGQVSWHIHDSELAWFSFLPTILERPWDGHDTQQKYDRLAGLADAVMAWQGVGWGAAADRERRDAEEKAKRPELELRRAVETALEPDSPERIAYNHVYEAMGDGGSPDQRRELFYKVLREARAGALIPVPEHTRDCGTKYRGCAPACPFDLAQKIARCAVPGCPGVDGDGCVHTTVAVDDLCESTFVEGCALPRGHRDACVARLNVNATPCTCSDKYRELAPGVHAKYCPLAGAPLDDGRRRWRCEPCNLTFRRERGEEGSVDTCIQCGKPTEAVRLVDHSPRVRECDPPGCYQIIGCSCGFPCSSEDAWIKHSVERKSAK